MKKTAPLCLSIVMALSQAFVVFATSQQPQPKPTDKDQTIKLKSELVQVRAVVTDKQGHLVTDLKKEDFELSENNHPQDISFFSVESVGDKAAPGAEKPAEPLTLRKQAQEQPARTVVLFADTVHLTFSTVNSTKAALRRFVNEQMTDQDMVALITSSGSLGLLEQFTRDRQVLRAAIERLTPWRSTAQESLFSPYLAAQIMQGSAEALALGAEIVTAEDYIDQPVPGYVRSKANQVLAEASYRRKATVATLAAVVDRVAGMPGQRMIALFSEGFTLLGSGGAYDAIDLQPTISRAVRSGVVIYSISAKGLQPVLVGPSMRGFVESSAGSRRTGGGTRLDRPSMTGSVVNSERDLQDGLNALARDTGGEAFFNTNDMTGRLQKALDENRVYYALAYQSPNPAGEKEASQFRRITLRVRNHPDYKVRTQRGYQPLEVKPETAAATPRQRLIQAMAAPLPTTDIAVSVAADYFERATDQGQALVQIYIDANALKYREQDAHYLFDIELATAVYDLMGKPAFVTTNEAHGDFAAERFETGKRNGYRYGQRLTLKPGVYQVQVGVLEPATEHMGTAKAWIEVPDLSRSKLALSSIILMREQKPNESSTKPASGAESMSPAVTQGIRVYKQGEVLEYHMMVYGTTTQEDNALQMQTEILHGSETLYQSPWRPVTGRTVAKDKKGVEVSEQLKLNNLKTGVYEVRITVKDAKTKKPPQRTMLFGVEP